MKKLPRECAQCGCPFWEQSKSSTGDAIQAWKDDLGTWHAGPSKETRIIRCANCQWSYSARYERGKLVETDYFDKLAQLLRGWVPSQLLSSLFTWPEEASMDSAEIDRLNGVLELRLRVKLTPPEKPKEGI